MIASREEQLAEVGGKVHVFERAGLGLGPFRLASIVEGAMDGCAFCGTGIKIHCHIVSADGQRFKVGTTCVNKTGDEGLRTALKAEEKARRWRKAEVRRKREWAKVLADKDEVEAGVEVAREALEAMPHPYGFEGKTAHDFATYMLENCLSADSIQKVRLQLKKAAL